jgi:hypothetical protein
MRAATMLQRLCRLQSLPTLKKDNCMFSILLAIGNGGSGRSFWDAPLLENFLLSFLCQLLL